MSVISYIPETVSFWGSGQTIYGVCSTYQGNILDGVKHALIGMNFMKLGYALYSTVPTSDLMKLSLCVNNLAMVAQGPGNVYQGIHDQNLVQAVKGVAQVVFGVLATAVIVSLDDKVISRACSIATCIGLSVSNGLHCKEKFAGGKKHEKVEALFNFLISLALTTYVVYDIYKGLNCTPYPHSQRALSQQQCESFIQSHQDELNQIYETKSASGNWTQLGVGRSKLAFVHPELPHGIIKIPTEKQFRTDDDLKLQFDNIQYAKNIVVDNKYQHILIPDSHLVPFKTRHILCETKFEFDPYPSFDSSREGWGELSDFLQKGRFCDINLWLWHNAAFLNGGSDIGVFDFDCRR